MRNHQQEPGDDADHGAGNTSRGERLVARMRGRATTGKSTDKLLRPLREPTKVPGARRDPR